MIDSSDFVCIVGAPRSGTTSLARFLGTHPKVDFSVVKEPHFFSRYNLADCSTAKLRDIVEKDYLARFFPDRSPERPLLAEGSVSYLYTPERMEPILRIWPKAKFVIAVRDPLQMLTSLHQRLLCTGDEAVTDFAAAWALTLARREGRRIPRSCIDPRCLDYRELARLGTHVERFFEIVGRERCFVSVFDDLTADPASLYSDLLEFLELPHDGRSSFPAHRMASGFKSGSLQRFLKRPPVITRQFLAGELFRQRVRRLDSSRKPPAWVRAIFAARERLIDWNQAPAPEPNVPLAVRREICEVFAGEIAQLGHLLGRDLGHWLDGTVCATFPSPAAGAWDHQPAQVARI